MNQLQSGHSLFEDLWTDTVVFKEHLTSRPIGPVDSVKNIFVLFKLYKFPLVLAVHLLSTRVQISRLGDRKDITFVSVEFELYSVAHQVSHLDRFDLVKSFAASCQHVDALLITKPATKLFQHGNVLLIRLTKNLEGKNGVRGRQDKQREDEENTDCKIDAKTKTHFGQLENQEVTFGPRVRLEHERDVAPLEPASFRSPCSRTSITASKHTGLLGVTWDLPTGQPTAFKLDHFELYFSCTRRDPGVSD